METFSQNRQQPNNEFGAAVLAPLRQTAKFIKPKYLKLTEEYKKSNEIPDKITNKNKCVFLGAKY